ELLAGLRAFGQLDLGRAGERGNLDDAAERGGRHRHGHLAVQVVAVALEDIVLLHADLDVEIARRPSIDSRLAVAARTDAHAVVDAGRDLHLQRLAFLHAADAVAGRAGVGDHLAAAAAGGAR